MICGYVFIGIAGFSFTPTNLSLNQHMMHLAHTSLSALINKDEAPASILARKAFGDNLIPIRTHHIHHQNASTQHHQTKTPKDTHLNNRTSICSNAALQCHS